ncbi:hypothetical protein SAMN02745166_01405 [Prosthecobacter debontii]|uniref:Uncharacterized protein n=1 Tax=Prosthecobacter debontii TaxID=48467 RepID=A0A1T4XGZ5_9BACT|nr:hypothetical protein [Prosthecobacter debontii]SKA88351.1 hypothetical protein SAMN02745166_01405 [Prosthecobacter debontii]
MSPELEQCLFDLAFKAYPQDEGLAKFKLIKRRRGTRPVAEMLADPFQTFSLRRGSDESKVETSKNFVTTLGVEVNALRPDPFVHLKRDEWPNIKPHVAFNHLFQEPLMLARLEGGYLASFEAGEFGGGLFYAQEEDEGWTRLIVGHFQDIQIFDQDHVLVTGGLEHMWVNGGETYLLTRTRQGKWKSRHVFSSRDGMPRLVGFCDLKALLGKESLFLYVLAVNSPSGFEWFLGVDKTGTVHVLGEREK